MATLIDKAEALKIAKQWADMIALMPSNARMCPKCLAIYERKPRDQEQVRVCYCDYESNDFP